MSLSEKNILKNSGTLKKNVEGNDSDEEKRQKSEIEAEEGKAHATFRNAVEELAKLINSDDDKKASLDCLRNYGVNLSSFQKFDKDKNKFVTYDEIDELFVTYDKHGSQARDLPGVQSVIDMLKKKLRKKSELTDGHEVSFGNVEVPPDNFLSPEKAHADRARLNYTSSDNEDDKKGSLRRQSFSSMKSRTPSRRISFRASMISMSRSVSGLTNDSDKDDENYTESVVKDLYAYLEADDGQVTTGQLLELLEDFGFTRADHRLATLRKRLKSINGIRRDIVMDTDTFHKMVKGSTVFLMKALKGQLAIPDFATFREDMKKIFEICKGVKGGQNATYIPQLAKADPELFSICVCTIDGQVTNYGDKDYSFCVQSCCKPISYLMAAEENGFDFVHNHVGREPSGHSFNEARLKSFPSEEQPNRQIPHNPMINAGAIMSCAMIKRDKGQAERFEHVMNTWERLCSSKVGFDNTVYLSEKNTANRNWCLGYMMQEFHSFPEPHLSTTLAETLEFYFQQCSITASCSQMAILAATLANGGQNPLTGDRIFDPFHVRNCLSLMLTCGMYDYSGEWCFTVGLPAKSGVAGCVWTVVPNKLGIASFSPPLDENGNSFKSLQVFREIVSIFNFHQYDNLKGVTNAKGLRPKKNPTSKPKQEKLNHTTALLFACFEGDYKK